MRFIAAVVFAGAASSAVAAAVSPLSSGKFHTTSSNKGTAMSASPSTDSTLSPPSVSVTLPATSTPPSSNIEADLVGRKRSSSKAAVITEMELAQPTDQPTPGGFKTIGCGCSYRHPNGYIECPYSGSTAPPGFCSFEVVTTTKKQGDVHTAQPTTTAAEGSSTPSSVANPTSVLSSIIAEASSWPPGVHPSMMPSAMPAPKETCVTTLDGTFGLGQKVTLISNKAAAHVAIPQISLINGTLIDDTNRIGCIVANGQFQFDLPPQAGTIYTAGWSACGPEGHRTLALGGNTTLYACNSGGFSNLYHKPIGSKCAPVELAIVMLSGHGATPDTAPEQQKRTATDTDFELAVPSVSAIADSPLIVDREAEPGFEGGFFNDQPADLNYLLTTKTVTLPAQTGVDPPYDGTPETTWTLPATTLVITESPAPTKVLNARQEGALGAIGSISYYASILSAAKSSLSAIEASLATMTTAGAAPQQTLPVPEFSPITAAPEITNAVAMRQEHDAIWTIDQLVSTILSAKSASEYYGWLAQSISMNLHEATATFINTACAVYDGIQSCRTESLFFATQNTPARARAAEATTTPIAPVEARQEGNPCEDLGCTPYTTLTRDFPYSVYTFPGDGTTRTTTIPAYTKTETWYELPGGDREKREPTETSVVTASVPVATITKVITASVSNDTTCTGNTTSVVSSASSYVNATMPTASYHLNTTLTSLSSAVVSPVTANNSTLAGHSTSTNTITTFVNATASQTSSPNSTAAQSTTAEVGGISSKADGGKQVALATVGMAFFAVLAFFL